MELTRLFDMGKARAAAFKKVGIVDFDALDICDAERVSKDLRKLGVQVSLSQIEGMRFHVQSYREGRPILFGSPPPLGESFIALDLEFDTINPRLWLIGLSLVDPHRRQNIALWAEDPSGERGNLERLAEILGERPRLPIVTWAGTSADVPQLKRASRRLEFEGLMWEIESRHVDLYAHVKRILRLPIPELKLGEVAAFFGVAKASSIADGREAQSLYDYYLTRFSSRVRKGIRDELITYNFDDLEALVQTHRAIERLPVENAQLSIAPVGVA